MSNTAAEGTPNWLPGFVQVDGDWSNTVIHKLHSLFIRDFKSNKLKYKNIPIWIDSKIEINDKNNYEKIFWHLIEREVEHNNEKERYPDFRRAGRIE
ncbi:MAG: hypothetical protein GY861_25635 [bacterium]|nr:hypothetical protein [bacterium]